MSDGISLVAVPSAFRRAIASSFGRVLSALWVSGLLGRVAISLLAVGPTEPLAAKECLYALDLAGCKSLNGGMDLHDIA